ncbi:NAD-dependent 4,6-dehydratase LegB [Thalassospira australica]|uniref:NAD-dependent 4,6-dehydratase LegB n=1 Tax=Thalassospira australica TaxID=1528106 RepID=UPI00051A253D|nr:NAD-dependent 4,6-dehydratase LegB [Thalassospira australica]
MNGKILVTGADGFIGSHLVEELVSQGREVRAFVLYNSFDSWGWLDQAPKEVKAAIEVVSGDVRDPICVKNAMKGCNAVMHLAALIAIPYSYVAPHSYVDVNVAGTLNVVQAARELGIDKVMHTSTSEVYGTAQFVPISEEHPLVGQSPYSASKIGADQIAMSYWRSFEVPVAIARPFNTYGPRQSARAVIPTVITQIAGGHRTIELGALSPTRDFNFVKDTVNGMIAILDGEASIGKTINIGSGYEISIGDMVKLVADIMNVEVEIVSRNERIRPEASEVERLLADATVAKSLLSWEPKEVGYQGLKQGLIETVNWFSAVENLSHYRIGQYTI